MLNIEEFQKAAAKMLATRTEKTAPTWGGGGIWYIDQVLILFMLWYMLLLYVMIHLIWFKLRCYLRMVRFHTFPSAPFSGSGVGSGVVVSAWEGSLLWWF